MKRVRVRCSAWIAHYSTNEIQNLSSYMSKSLRLIIACYFDCKLLLANFKAFLKLFIHSFGGFSFVVRLKYDNDVKNWRKNSGKRERKRLFVDDPCFSIL